MSKTAVLAQTPSGAEEWIVHAADEEPWEIRAVAPDGRSFEATSTDLFHALQLVRSELAPWGVQLLCNGARSNARPSPQTSGAGGGMVYLLPSLRNPRVEDLVPLLSPARADQVTSVAEQEAFWSRYCSSTTRSALRALSPIAALKRLEAKFRMPPAWVAEVREGVTIWSYVRH